MLLVYCTGGFYACRDIIFPMDIGKVALSVSTKKLEISNKVFFRCFLCYFIALCDIIADNGWWSLLLGVL